MFEKNLATYKGQTENVKLQGVTSGEKLPRYCEWILL